MEFVARQVQVPASEMESYDWRGRTAADVAFSPDGHALAPRAPTAWCVCGNSTQTPWQDESAPSAGSTTGTRAFPASPQEHPAADELNSCQLPWMPEKLSPSRDDAQRARPLLGTPDRGHRGHSCGIR